MRKRFRNAFYASLSFLILAYSYPGFQFAEPKTILVATLVFAVIYLFVRPIFSILSLPLNFLTFGFFSLILNVGILYLIAYFVPGFDIVGYRFSGLSVFSIELTGTDLNAFFSAAAASVLLGFLSSTFFWIFS
ncbi:MAG: phage holin family protein [Candidatus Woykebacteria bacterium]